jgi:hypothetical protein
MSQGKKSNAMHKTKSHTCKQKVIEQTNTDKTAQGSSTHALVMLAKMLSLDLAARQPAVY